jgi:transposase
MPRYLSARRAAEQGEAHHVRRLAHSWHAHSWHAHSRHAHSRHAPADWITHAKMVARSWEGQRVRQIAQALGRHRQTVRDRLQACNERGLEGWGMKPGAGRKPRLTEQERSLLLALVKAPPPGKATDERTGELAAPHPEGEPEWTLDTLTAAARERGIHVARRPVRRIFRQEGVRWRRTRRWATSKEPDFVPKGGPSSRSTPRRPPARRSSASTNSAR